MWVLTSTGVFGVPGFEISATGDILRPLEKVITTGNNWCRRTQWWILQAGDMVCYINNTLCGLWSIWQIHSIQLFVYIASIPHLIVKIILVNLQSICSYCHLMTKEISESYSWLEEPNMSDRIKQGIFRSDHKLLWYICIINQCWVAPRLYSLWNIRSFLNSVHVFAH